MSRPTIPAHAAGRELKKQERLQKEQRRLLAALAQTPGKRAYPADSMERRSYESLVAKGYSVEHLDGGFSATLPGIERLEVKVGRPMLGGGKSPRLSELIEACGGSRGDVASKIGTTEATIGKWANGKSAPTGAARKNLMELAKDQGVDADGLVTELETLARGKTG